jgi:thymidylate synthase (FAD)
MGKITILDQTTKNPFTLIGRMSGVAYGSDISDDTKNYKRGVNCVKADHGRVLEFPEVYMTMEGYSARVMREFFRHVGDGLSAIQASTRYIDYNNFDYYTPPGIEKKSDAKYIYDKTMKKIIECYDDMLKVGVAKEDAANILPLGMTSTVAIKKNARNLAEMSHVRLCNRAYIEYRGLMKDITDALCEYSQEWKELCELLFKPKCEVCGYCNEEYSCGKYPKKN